jgi:hypothetical protein
MVLGQSEGGSYCGQFKRWLSTTEGWAKANIVYDTLSEPPAPDSPLEAICMYIFNQRQLEKITHAKLMSMSSFQNDKGAQEVLSKYIDLLLPSATSATPTTPDDVKQALGKIVTMGSFVATPVEHTRRVIKK